MPLMVLRIGERSSGWEDIPYKRLSTHATNEPIVLFHYKILFLVRTAGLALPPAKITHYSPTGESPYLSTESG